MLAALTLPSLSTIDRNNPFYNCNQLGCFSAVLWILLLGRVDRLVFHAHAILEFSSSSLLDVVWFICHGCLLVYYHMLFLIENEKMSHTQLRPG